MDWSEMAVRVRAHAQDHADILTAATGQQHRIDPALYRLAALCDAAAYSPGRPNARLERDVVEALGRVPRSVPSTGGFDLSGGVVA